MGSSSDNCCCCCKLECGIKCIGTMDIIMIVIFFIDIIATGTSYSKVGGPIVILFVQPILMLILVSLPRSIAFCIMMANKKRKLRRKAAYLIRMVGSGLFVFFFLIMIIILGVAYGVTMRALQVYAANDLLYGYSSNSTTGYGYGYSYGTGASTYGYSSDYQKQLDDLLKGLNDYGTAIGNLYNTTTSNGTNTSASSNTTTKTNSTTTNSTTNSTTNTTKTNTTISTLNTTNTTKTNTTSNSTVKTNATYPNGTAVTDAALADWANTYGSTDYSNWGTSIPSTTGSSKTSSSSNNGTYNSTSDYDTWNRAVELALSLVVVPLIVIYAIALVIGTILDFYWSCIFKRWYYLIKDDIEHLDNKSMSGTH